MSEAGNGYGEMGNTELNTAPAAFLPLLLGIGTTSNHVRSMLHGESDDDDLVQSARFRFQAS